MAQTVRELINDLLYYPMDAKVVITINGEGGHEIADIAKYWGDDDVVIDIEVPEEE